MVDERLRHRAYTREHGDDPPDVRDWVWPATEASRAGPRRQRGVEQPEARGCSTTTTRCWRRDLPAPRDRSSDSPRRSTALPRARRGRAPRRARRRALHAAGPCSTTRSCDRAASARPTLAPLHQPQVARGARRRRRGAAGRARRWRASTPPSTRTLPGGRRDLRAARGRGASAGRCAATASTASRTRTPPGGPASCSGAGRRAGSSPATSAPGASLRAVARRPLGRHDDGLHAAGGPGHGDPVGQRRPRAAAVAASSTRARRRPSWPTALEHESGLLGPRRAPPTCARCSRAASGDDVAALALDVYLHRLRAGDRRDGRRAGRPRRARLHRRRRRARGPAAGGDGPGPGACSASRSTPRATTPPSPTRRSARAAPRSGRS